MAVIVELDLMLARRRMSVGEFASAVGITPANVAVLKNGRARAIRLTTLDAICRVLDCQPGEILRWVPDEPAAIHAPGAARAPATGDPAVDA